MMHLLFDVVIFYRLRGWGLWDIPLGKMRKGEAANPEIQTRPSFPITYLPHGEDQLGHSPISIYITFKAWASNLIQQKATVPELPELVVLRDQLNLQSLPLGRKGRW
jgi:hypothetical protein